MERPEMATEYMLPYLPQRQPCLSLYPDFNSRACDSHAAPLATALPSAPPFPILSFGAACTEDRPLDGRICDDTKGCLFGLPEEIRHNLAMFLSCGDPTVLHVSPENVGFFMSVANTLHHTQLRDICLRYTKEHGNATSNTTEIEGNCSCLKSKALSHFLAVPVFTIMFPIPLHVGQQNQVLVMDMRNNEIHKIDVRKVTRFGDGFVSCAVYKKGCPYVMISGGVGKTERTLLRYDVVENKWAHCDDMTNARSKHAMVFLNGNVFVIGGRRCASIERYNIENNICIEIARLKESVHSPAACVYGEDIYIFGGKTIKGNVSCVQKFDTRLNTVVRLADLPVPCSGGHAVVVKDSIFIATNRGHMIKYMPTSGQSELCKSQPYRRKHFAMFQKSHELFIFGGVKTEAPVQKHDTCHVENTLDKYCTKSDTWSHVHSYKDSVPVYTCCTVKYPKACPVKPFMKLFGYC